MRSRRGQQGGGDPLAPPVATGARSVVARGLDPTESEPPSEGGHWSLGGLARIVRLDEGLHAIRLGTSQTAGGMVGGLALPSTCVAAGPPGDGEPVQIFPSTGSAPGWLGAAGGAVVAQAPRRGGVVILTTYGIDDPAQLPRIEIERLDAAAAAGPSDSSPTAEVAGTELPIEIILHIERQGDRQLPGHGWVGNRGQRLRIEAFGIRPLKTLTPAHLRYMAFGPGGRQTPWVTDARLCGTRGRGLPLTGFAISLAPEVADRFDVVYEGSFFDSGAVGAKQNGEACLPPIANDPLEAMRIRLIQRTGE